MIEKFNRYNVLLDFYGVLLTKRQYSFMELYYKEDLSLGEISEQYNITRQAVYDIIKKSEKILDQYELKLEMVNQYQIRRKLKKNILKMLKVSQEKYNQSEEYLTLIKKIEENLKKL